MSRLMTSDDFLYNVSYQVGPYLAALKGPIFRDVVDETIDNNCTIPMTTSFIKIAQTNTNFSSSNSSPTVSLTAASGLKVNRLLLQFSLPAQYAKNKSDQFCYDSLPGIKCINQIEVYVNGFGQSETMRPTGMIQRLIDYYGVEWMEKRGAKLLGGLRTDVRRDDNQTLKGYTNQHFNSSDYKENLITPEVKIDLPVPVHLFYNEEKFAFMLSLNSMVELKFIFNPIQAFSSYTRDMVPEPFAGSLLLYAECIGPIEQKNVFNNLPYSGAHERSYYFKDVSMDIWSKSSPYNHDLQCVVKSTVTKRIAGYVYDKVFSSGLTFYGDDVDTATEVFLASLIMVDVVDTAHAYTVCLNTGKFVNGADSFEAISIHAHSTTSITLAYNKTNSVMQKVKITSTVPWSRLSCLYINLKSTPHLIPPISSISPSLFNLESFNLNFCEFDSSDEHYGIMDERVTTGSATKLINGFFVFPAVAIENTPDRSYSLRAINVVTLKKTITKDMWDLAISQPVAEPSVFSIFGSKRFVKIQRTCYPYLTLDGTQPIRVAELNWEENGSNSRVLTTTDIENHVQLEKIPHYWSPTFDLDYSYKNYISNVDTHGSKDFRAQNTYFLKVTPKLEQVNYIVDGELITTLAKHRTSGRAIDYEIVMVQEFIRPLKYDISKKIQLPGFDELGQLNYQIYDHKLTGPGIDISLGVTVENDLDNETHREERGMVEHTRQSTKHSHDDSVQPIAKRQRVTRYNPSDYLSAHGVSKRPDITSISNQPMNKYTFY